MSDDECWCLTVNAGAMLMGMWVFDGGCWCLMVNVGV